MFNQILLWSFFILPWLVLFFLKKHKVKRYFPGGLFGALILTVIFQIAEKYHWWTIEENIPILTNVTTFVYGSFLVGTIIILYFTFGNFIKYLVTNLIIDSLLSFGISKWYEHLNIYKLVNINSFGVYIVTTVVAILIYFYQIWQDKLYSQSQKG
ncbi:hypothetical protein NDK25_13760 [Niallia taxi]|nr:hypothetical protein [Niallia taxi]MDE5053298.1 hypothetical protein [Niallia taxi]